MSFRKILSVLLVLTFLAAALPVGTAASSNVASIEVTGFEVIEGTHGWSVTSTLGSGESYDWYEYDIEPDEITVNYKDGSSVTCSPAELRNQGLEVDFYSDQEQRYDAPWGIGEHWVTCEVDGVTTTYIITVTESPVESVMAIGRSYMEGTNCWQHTNYDAEGNAVDRFIWYDDKPSTVIITYKDNTQLVCDDPNRLEELTGYEGHWRSNQDEKHWGVGKHTATFEYLGASCTYEIEITESPYLSVSVAKVTITEGTHCNTASYNGVDYQRYNYSPDIVTVKFKDGTSRDMDSRARQEEFGEVGFFDDDQGPGSEWGVGVHTVNYRLGNMTCDFEVEIVPGPIESITAVDFVCIEGLDGYTDYDFDWDTMTSRSWFRYMYDNTVVTITLRDGTEITTRDGGFNYDGQYYNIDCVDDQSYDHQWEVGGKYTGTLRVAGKTCSITVWVDPSPIDHVEFDPIVLTENVDGYVYQQRDYMTGEVVDTYFYYEYYPDYTVYFDDGTSQRSDRGWFEMFGEHYCIEYWDGQHENHWGVGDHEIEMKLAGYSTKVTATVVPDNVAGVEISGDDDLFITINYTDGSSKTFKALGFESNGYGVGIQNGTIDTEERNIPVKVSYAISDEGVNMYDRDVSVAVGTHESNTLERCSWFKTNVMFDNVLYYTAVANRMNGFAGFEAGGRYDPASLAFIALYSCVSYEYVTDYSEDGMLCLAQYETPTVKAAVSYLFGIDDFDAESIEYNDPSDKDHVWIRVPGAAVELPSGRDRDKTPGGWNFFFRPDDPDDYGYDVLTIGTDADLVINSITFSDEAKLTALEISGDLTLEIKATFSDGTEATCTATAIDVDNPAAYPLTGTLHTDAGDAEVEIKFDILRDGTHRFVDRNVSITIDGVTSNTLPSNAWIKSRLLGNSLPFVASIFKLARPDWEGVDAESASANDLVEFATYCTGEFSNYEVNFANGKAYIKVPTDVARSIVYYVFGVDSLDLSKYSQIGTSGTSEYLDVELFDFDFADIPGGTTEIEYTDNPDFDMVGMEHNSDKWTVTFTVTDGDPGYDEIVVTADWQFNVEKIEFIGGPQHIPGDVDGNGGVNMKDILLLRRVLAGDVELSPEEQSNADVNGDGAVNMKDILLLRRIVAGDA